jgi:hypothetical protein
MSQQQHDSNMVTTWSLPLPVVSCIDKVENPDLNFMNGSGFLQKENEALRSRNPVFSILDAISLLLASQMLVRIGPLFTC